MIRKPFADVVQFTRSSAERIGRVVVQVENAVPEASPLTFDAIASGSRVRPIFRVATFTGSWSKNAAKVVTLKYQTTTPNTMVATNLFAAIGTASSSRNCAIAREGTAWFLIAAECS